MMLEMQIPKKNRLSSAQPSAVFDGVYSNARMLHFLTAVVGSTCRIQVKSGLVYEGIFKTLSSKCDLAVDAVHQHSELADSSSAGDGSATSSPRWEEIVDTMVFSPSDLVTMTCKDVDLNYATRDSFTDMAISATRTNGEHREKVLQRWDGGDGELCELETDTINGWDPNDMFKFNEENYGVKSTYDSSLAMYTMPLERNDSEDFRQREVRASQLAHEIESSVQYQQRVALEDEDGKSEEEKYSAVVRDGGSVERGRARDSPSSREGRYFPQRREVGPTVRGYGAGTPAAFPSRLSRPNMSNTTFKSIPPTRGGQASLLTEQCSPARNISSPPTPSATSAYSCPAAGVQAQSLSGAGMVVNGVEAISQEHLCSLSPVPVTIPPPTGLAPTFPVDVNEVLGSAGRIADGAVSPSHCKSNKVQQRSQIEELRKFGKEFRLQSSSSASFGCDSIVSPPENTTQSCQTDPVPHADPVQAEESVDNPEDMMGPGHSDRQSLDGEEAKEDAADRVEFVTDQVKKSTLNPNAKEFNPSRMPLFLTKPSLASTPPRPTAPSPSLVLQAPVGQGAIYSPQYISYIPQAPMPNHFVQAPAMYPYTLPTVNQGKYPRAKGTAGTRLDHGSPAANLLQAATSQTSGPLIPSPYSQTYLQYNSQQYGHQVLQAMTPYPGQPVYSVLPGGARMLASNVQPLTPTGPPYPLQGEGPPGPQQALYAPQGFPHHTGTLHPPQPSGTPTGIQAPQDPAPAPGQPTLPGQQSQSLYAPLPGPTNPNMLPAHTPTQGPYPLPGYSLHGQHAYPSVPQAHMSGALAVPPHSGSQGSMMVLHAPHHAQTTQQGTHPPYPYMAPLQAVQVQSHPSQQLPFSPHGN